MPAQDLVDLGAVAQARGVARQPAQVVRVLAREVAQRPAGIAAEARAWCPRARSAAAAGPMAETRRPLEAVGGPPRAPIPAGAQRPGRARSPRPRSAPPCDARPACWDRGRGGTSGRAPGRPRSGPPARRSAAPAGRWYGSATAIGRLGSAEDRLSRCTAAPRSASRPSARPVGSKQLYSKSFSYSRSTLSCPPRFFSTVATTQSR